MTTYQSTLKDSERILEWYANNNRASITVRDPNNPDAHNLFLSPADARKLGQELLDTFPEPRYTVDPDDPRSVLFNGEPFIGFTCYVRSGFRAKYANDPNASEEHPSIVATADYVARMNSLDV